MGKIENALPQPRTQQIATKTNTSRSSDLRHIVRLMSRFLVGERRIVIIALVLLIAEAGTAVFEAYPLAYLIDFLQGSRSDLPAFLGLPAFFSPLVDTVALLTASIVVMAMINSLADSLAEIYLARGGRALGYNMRVELYSHLQRLSLSFHDKRRTGDVLTRVTSDVAALEDFVIGSLSDIVGSLLMLVGTMAFLLYHSWEVALVAAVIIPIMSLVSNHFSQRIKAAAKKQRACEGDLASSTQEMLTSIRVIQTYSRAGYEQQRFANHTQRAREAALLAAGLQARFSWVVKVMEALAISSVVWLGLWLIGQSALTIGTLVLFIVLIQNMFKPTRKIIKEWNTIGKVYASVERIGELLDRQPTVVDLPGTVEAPRLSGAVEFRQVSFNYQPDPEDAAGWQEPAALALRDISFSIAPGEVLALVGHTGAGKSTIAQLLPRLYDPSAGEILIDGRNIRDYTLDSLRSQISVVLQETILFSGSVAENIAYGRTDASREAIVAAATHANAHEFIEKLPDGYDTLLGERGANLSGGQRQRIAIARAFIRATPILILDEPTTGLDVESAEQVLLALRTLMQGKTTIIISHDLKLIRHANKIVVIKAGAIEQIGRHQDLLDAEGLYANLYLKQFAEHTWEQGPEKSVPDTPPAGVPKPGYAPPSEALRVEAAPATSAVDAAQVRGAPIEIEQLIERIGTRYIDDLRMLSDEMARFYADQFAVQDAQIVVLGQRVAIAEQARDELVERVRELKAISADYISNLQVLSEGLSRNGEITDDDWNESLDGAQAIERQGEEPYTPVEQGISTPAGNEVTSPQIDAGNLNPLHNPAAQQELPGLATAFEAEAMRELLQVALFGEANGAYTIERCAPGKATYLPGDSCVLRYELEIRDNASGEIISSLLNARAFPSQAACTVYLQDKLEPLAAQMRQRDEIAPFATPIAMLESLNLAVSVFPIDGELPMLVEATDPQRMLEIFRSIPELAADGFAVEDCRVELGHYGRQHRCVLRYCLEGHLPGSDAAERRIVYGKVANDDRGAMSNAAVEQLGKHLQDGSHPFRIPRAFGFWPELRLALLEAISGQPHVSKLLKARLKGAELEPGLPSIEEVMTVAARMAAALHGSGGTLGQRRTLADELDKLRPEVADIERVSPELGAQLRAWLERVEACDDPDEALEFCFSHGDFTHTQLVFDGTTSGLVDFDTVCQAEPALDLGHFLAYVRLAFIRVENAKPADVASVESLCDQFMDAYIEAAGAGLENIEQLRLRVAVYEVVSLLRMAVHSWQKLKSSRLTYAVTMLEERVSCLPQLSH